MAMPRGARITVPLAMDVGWCLQVPWAIGTNVRSRINQLRARLGTAARPPADEAAASLAGLPSVECRAHYPAVRLAVACLPCALLCVLVSPAFASDAEGGSIVTGFGKESLGGFVAERCGTRIHCPRAQYPYMQLQVYACSRLQRRPPVIRLDPANYARLRAEMEKCAGHPIPGRISLCGIPVVPATPVKGREIFADT